MWISPDLIWHIQSFLRPVEVRKLILCFRWTKVNERSVAITLWKSLIFRVSKEPRVSSLHTDCGLVNELVIRYFISREMNTVCEWCEEFGNKPECQDLNITPGLYQSTKGQFFFCGDCWGDRIMAYRECEWLDGIVAALKPNPVYHIWPRKECLDYGIFYLKDLVEQCHIERRFAISSVVSVLQQQYLARNRTICDLERHVWFPRQTLDAFGKRFQDQFTSVFFQIQFQQTKDLVLGTETSVAEDSLVSTLSNYGRRNRKRKSYLGQSNQDLIGEHLKRLANCASKKYMAHVVSWRSTSDYWQLVVSGIVFWNLFQSVHGTMSHPAAGALIHSIFSQIRSTELAKFASWPVPFKESLWTVFTSCQEKLATAADISGMASQSIKEHCDVQLWHKDPLPIDDGRSPEQSVLVKTSHQSTVGSSTVKTRKIEAAAARQTFHALLDDLRTRFLTS